HRRDEASWLAQVIVLSHVFPFGVLARVPGESVHFLVGPRAIVVKQFLHTLKRFPAHDDILAARRWVRHRNGRRFRCLQLVAGQFDAHGFLLEILYAAGRQETRMNPTTEQLVNSALALPDGDRLELVEALIASLQPAD